jgi:DNA-binding response OmpR family regulator
VTANAIDVTVSSLRQALGKVELGDGALSEVTIETERGIGYRLSVAPTSEESPSSSASN